MVPAEYGNKWFVFRKRRMGIPAAHPSETINLKPFFIPGHYLPQWNEVLEHIPYGNELSDTNTIPARKQFLEKAITLFENKEEENSNSSDHSLSLDMQYLYAQALEMKSRIDLAKKQLEYIVKHHPSEKEIAHVMLSEIYERKGDWINVYETLRTYLFTNKHNSVSADDLSSIKPTWPPTEFETKYAENIHLKPLLRLIKSQLRLKMRLAALHTARETVRLFPYSAGSIEILAGAQLELGNAEYALKLLQQPRLHDIRNLDIIEADALFKTQRFKEIDPFCRSAMLPRLSIPQDTIQQTSLPPAELAVLWHRISIPSEEQFRLNAEHLRNNLSTAGPGLRNMLSLWIKAYEQHCLGGSASQQLWLDCGRDPLERATALNQLTLLLCREELYSEAKIAAKNAVSALPDEPLLWLILISLSDSSPATVEQARHACPDDPELWLAELVLKTHPENRKSEVGGQSTSYQSTKNLWLSKTISEAIEKQMPPAILTRAGEYLRRNNMHTEAVRLARNISGRARGLLPAYIFTMRCALYEKDEKWALQCTKNAIQSALHPLPEFYENLVNLKVADGKIDTEPDMINALCNLRKTDPDNQAWAQMLGYIRFRRGGWEIVDAMFQMQSAINHGATNPAPYLIASEASRLLRNYDRAIDILHQGLKHNPDNSALINNLAFTMTHSPKYIDDVAAMIPQLQQLAEDNPQIKDTLAAVYIHTSKLDSAMDTIKSILNDTHPGSPIWFRAKTHLARIARLRGQNAEAIALLNGLLKNLKQIPDEDILRANALLTQIKEADQPTSNSIPYSP
jgi:tetratricopeptide (TPR) repeat protein